VCVREGVDGGELVELSLPFFFFFPFFFLSLYSLAFAVLESVLRDCLSAACCCCGCSCGFFFLSRETESTRAPGWIDRRADRLVSYSGSQSASSVTRPGSRPDMMMKQHKRETEQVHDNAGIGNTKKKKQDKSFMLVCAVSLPFFCDCDGMAICVSQACSKSSTSHDRHAHTHTHTHMHTLVLHQRDAMTLCVSRSPFVSSTAHGAPHTYPPRTSRGVSGNQVAYITSSSSSIVHSLRDTDMATATAGVWCVRLGECPTSKKQARTCVCVDLSLSLCVCLCVC